MPRRPTRGSALLFAVALVALFVGPAPVSFGGLLVALLGLPLTERRDGTIGAAGWSNAAAFLGTLVAADLGFQGTRDRGLALGVDFATASPDVSHAAFHLAGAGIATIGAAVLLLFVLWVPLRRGELWAFAAIAAAGVVEVVLLLEPIRREFLDPSYGHDHPSVWLIPIAWLATLIAAARCLMLVRRLAVADGVTSPTGSSHPRSR